MSVTPIAWPTLSVRPSAFTWHLLPHTQTWTSPLNGSSQTQELPGARWICKLPYRKMREDDWRAFTVFVARLRGAAGRFYLSPLHALPARGVATGTPLVYGAAQTGTSLITDGWTPSTANILRAGDYFHVATASGRELKLITADANSASDGKATLVFEPPLRASPADNAALEVTAPSCAMRLTGDDQGQFEWSGVRYGDSSVEMVEAWL
ncbi:MAG: hypothetical protein AB9900_10970 [Humidesulfovibrio sp.]